jgi:hypothetical protein
MQKSKLKGKIMKEFLLKKGKNNLPQLYNKRLNQVNHLLSTITLLQ